MEGKKREERECSGTARRIVGPAGRGSGPTGHNAGPVPFNLGTSCGVYDFRYEAGVRL